MALLQTNLKTSPLLPFMVQATGAVVNEDEPAHTPVRTKAAATVNARWRRLCLAAKRTVGSRPNARANWCARLARACSL